MNDLIIYKPPKTALKKIIGLVLGLVVMWGMFYIEGVIISPLSLTVIHRDSLELGKVRR